MKFSSFCRATVFLIFSGAVLSSALADVRINFTRPTSWTAELGGTRSPGTQLTLALSPLSEDGSASFQWLHDGVPIQGATSAAFEIQSAVLTDSGNYVLRVTRAAKVEISNDLTVNILPLPLSPTDPTFRSELARSASGAPVAYSGVLYVDAQGGAIVTATDPELKYPSIRVLRLLPDGKIDSSFAFGAGADSLVVFGQLPDGGLVVSNFPFVLNANGSARQNAAVAAEFSANAPLSAGLVLSDGRFLLAQRGKLKRFRADGSLDPLFDFSTTLPNAAIYNLTLDLQQRVYVGLSSESQDVLLCLQASGAVDPSFAFDAGPPQVFQAIRRKLYPLPDGRFLLQITTTRGSTSFYVMSRTGELSSGQGGWSGFMSAFDLTTGAVYFGLSRYRVTGSELLNDNFYGGEVDSGSVRLTPDGKMLVGVTALSEIPPGSGNLLRLRTTDATPLRPAARLPATSSGATLLTQYSTPALPRVGAAYAITPVVSGTGPLAYQWIALDGQPLPVVSTTAALTIPNFDRTQLGRYQLRVTGPGGSTLSNVLNLRDLPAYLANLSGRALTGTGENTVIAGLVSQPGQGATSSILVRGAGPSLAPYGIARPAVDPMLTISRSGSTFAANDDWEWNSVESSAASVGAFPMVRDSKDAALIVQMPGGGATALLENKPSESGVALVEVYGLRRPDYSAPSDVLLNLSFRAFTAPGEQTAIAGFVIADPLGGSRSARVLLRAIGPSLANAGISHPLSNPVLTVYNAAGDVIAQNDDWATTIGTGEGAAVISAATRQVGAFELLTTSKDAALLLDLPAGAYSMHATGGSGVALLEIYLVQ